MTDRCEDWVRPSRPRRLALSERWWSSRQLGTGLLWAPDPMPLLSSGWKALLRPNRRVRQQEITWPLIPCRAATPVEIPLDGSRLGPGTCHYRPTLGSPPRRRSTPRARRSTPRACRPKINSRTMVIPPAWAAYQGPAPWGGWTTHRWTRAWVGPRMLARGM